MMVIAAAIAIYLITFLRHDCQGWSVFGRRRSSSNNSRHAEEPPRRTRALVQHLEEGPSRVNNHASIVALSKFECGIQWDTAADDDDVDQRKEDRSSISEDRREVAYVARSEFITPQCGLETRVGQTVKAYFEQGRDVYESHAESLPSIYIAIFLCLTRRQKLPAGQFEAYLETLPSLKALQHLPVFWTRKELEELQSSAVKDAVMERIKSWKEEYMLVQNALKNDACSAHDTSKRNNEVGFSFVDLKTWFWARSIITSRAFTDKATNGVCLVPFVDMMNHVSNNDAVHDLPSEEGTNYVIKCNWKLDASGFRLELPPSCCSHNSYETVHDNDELHGSHRSESSGNKLVQTQHRRKIEISYGSHSNSEFLINYGFSVATDDNIEQLCHDNAILSLTLDSPNSSADEDESFEENTAMVEKLWEADGLGDCHTIRRNVTVSIGNAGPMQSLLSLCRVASCHEQEELGRMKDAFVQEGATTTQTEDGLVPQMGATLCRCPFSIPNEIRAMQMLQRITRNSLGKYKTTLAQDEQILDCGLNWRQRWFGNAQHWNRISHALAVRRGEKQVIQHFNNLATLALQFLSVQNVDFEQYKGMLMATLEDEHPILNNNNMAAF